jgi:Uma2 family endonuclease
MIEAGVLTDDDPVELLEGILVFKMPKKPAHRLALRKISKAIEKLLPEGWFIQLQEPITLSDGEPEPDASIVRGADEDFAARHPGPNDVALVIEVADTTLARDRGIKLRSYANAGIQMYWIVDLVGRCVEVYTSPNPNASTPAYAPPSRYDEKTSVPLMLEGKQVGEIAVFSILP